MTPLADVPNKPGFGGPKAAGSNQRLADRSAELQGLMAKAETGVGGAVVAEVAYRNEYLAVRGQEHFAEEAWRKNKCRETPPSAPAAPANAKPVVPSKAGGAVL